MRYAMAASVMAALIATGLVFLQRPSSDLLVAANELGTGVEPAFHRLARARGQSRDVVVVGPATRYIELRAVVDRPAGTMYEIRLRRLDGGASRELGVSDAAAADGEVATYLHAEHLPAGRYELSVTPRAGGEAHTLEFEVDRRP